MFAEEREQVAYFMRRLYSRGLTTTSGGNVSLRVSSDRVLLTASASDKATLKMSHVVILSLTGDNLTPELAPSIEAGMHLAIYRLHPEIKAVVHAHPTTATAFCAAGERINCRLTTEAYAILADPVYLPFAMSGSAELANVVATGIGSAACALMPNHGILAVGDSLLQAFDRMEVLEEAAKLTLITRLLGSANELDEQRLRALDELMGRHTGNAAGADV